MTLKEWLRENDVLQRQLAKRLGVSPETVSYWCQGKRIAQPGHRQRISEITGGEVSMPITKEQ